MKRIVTLISLSLLFYIAFSSCEALSKIPTNTTGGVFSLNGNWQLQSSNDSNAMVGTSITVLPVIGNGTVKSLESNTYCMRTGDAIWKNIKNAQTGGFTLDNLVSACNGLIVYKAASIAVVDNDAVKLTGLTVNNKELIQQWKRLLK